MKSYKIGVDGLSDALKDVLNDYKKVVVDGQKKSAKDAMDQLVKDTRETAPVRTGKYKRHITSKKNYENSEGAEYLWYVKSPSYRLSHLLEFGHQTRSGGRTKATHFIENALNPIAEMYLKKLEDIIKNG